MTFARYLALSGFKPFRDWSLLDLSPRVSVLVGKNGSGKSSLVEALLWVLGEQDMGLLRAESSRDLLFHRPGEILRPERTEREQHLIFVDHRDQDKAGDPQGGDGGTGAAEAAGRESIGVCEAVVYLVLGDEADVACDDPGEGACCCKAVVEQRREVPEGLITVRRRLDATGSDSYDIEGARASPAEVELALGKHGLDRGRVSVVRQGELERILLVDAEMRAGILAEAGGLELSGTGDEEMLVADLVVAALEQWGTEDRLPGGRKRLLHLLGLSDPPQAGWNPDVAPPSPQTLEESLAQKEQAREQQLRELHTRVEERFARFFTHMVPGGRARLPLDLSKGLRRATLDVRVAFPDSGFERLEALSGGQRSLVAFLEVPSPALVLDEVEPALDEALVRRLTRLLHEVGRERQVLAVSHQTLMRHTAGHVLHIERKEGRSRIGMQYNPRLLRGPSAPARAR